MISDADVEAILRQERVVADILRLREKDKPPAWWDKGGIVPAATAVLTVVVTSIASYESQRALKDQESALASAHEQAQLVRDVAKRANGAVAAMLKVNDERLMMARGQFDDLSDDQLRGIARNTNRLQQEWRQQREDVEIDLHLVFDSASGVSTAWGETRAALERQTSCLEAALRGAQQGHIHEPTCTAELAASESAVSVLRRRLKIAYDRIPAAR